MNKKHNQNIDNRNNRKLVLKSNLDVNTLYDDLLINDFFN